MRAQAFVRYRLDRNENLWGCAPAVTEAVRRLSAGMLSRYPDVSRLQERMGGAWGLTLDRVLVTASGDEAIRCVLDALPADAPVAVPEPGFPVYRWAAEVRNRPVHGYPMNADYRYDRDKLVKAARAAELLVIMSPHNPCGSALDPGDLAAVLSAAPDTGVLVDEAYGEFGGVSAVNLLSKHSNLLILKTFSKAYGLAGLRLGALLGSPDRLAAIARFQMPYAVSATAVAAGLAALESGDHVERSRFRVMVNRRRMVRILARRGLSTLPSVGNFLSVRSADPEDRWADRLEEAGIAVRPLTAHGMPGWCRITVGTRESVVAVYHALAKDRPDTVLFDMDGVLVDVTGSYRAAIRETVRQLGGTVPAAETVQGLKDKGNCNNDWDLALALLRQQGWTGDRAQVVQTFQAILWGEAGTGWIRRDRLRIDPSLLARLGRRFRLGIVTGRPVAEARATLARFGLSDRFPVVVTAEDVPRGKPDPAGLDMAMKRLGTTRGLYLGDTVDDMRAALRAGLVPVGVLPPGAGRSTRRALIRSGAADVLTGPDRLEGWLDANGN